MPASMGRDEVLDDRGANTATPRLIQGGVLQSKDTRVGVAVRVVGWTTGRKAGGEKEPLEEAEAAKFRHRQSSSWGDDEQAVAEETDTDDDDCNGYVKMKLSDCWQLEIEAT